MALQHLRSSTAHKRPIPTVMSAGQIAINTNEASPGLFFKDSNGDLVKVGPVHIGTTAPNSSPASVAATALVTGTVYQILTVGTSDFTLVGASANTVGTIFTATGTTTGTGTVSGQQGVEKGEQWLDTTGGAYDLKIYDGTDWRSQAGEFVNATGDTMTGDLVMNNANIVFEGATADDFETTLTVTDPTADRSIVLPDVSGDIVTTGDTGTVTSTMIADGTIVNADVNASAAIAGTKIDPDFGIQEVTNASNVNLGAATNATISLGNSTNTTAQVVKLGTASAGPVITVQSAGIGGGGATDKVRIVSDIFLGTNALYPSATLDKDGNIKVADGAAATPSIAFTDDTNTGIYRPSADQLAISTNGTAAVTVDSSQRVGIGTTSPGSYEAGKNNFVIANTGGNAGLTIASVSSGFGEIAFADGTAGSEKYRGQISYDHTNDALKLFTAASEALRIDSSGNVGIGTTSPASILHVEQSGGAAYIRSRSTTNGVQAFFGASNGGVDIGSESSDVLRFYTNNGQKAQIDSSGRVGIGTSSPDALLTVSGVNNIHAHNASGDASIGLSTGGTPASPTKKYTLFVDDSDGDKFIINDSTAGERRLTIDTSGRIGVGTTGPGALLDARGAVRLGNQGNGDGTTGIVSTNGVYIGTNYGTTTSTVTALQIGGYPAAPSYSGTPDQAIVLDGWSGSTVYHNAIVNRRGRDLSFHTAITGTSFSDTNERARIDSSGRLLVGTSNNRTSYNLQLEGTTGATAGASFIRNETGNSGGTITLGKSGGTTNGSFDVVSNNDTLGSIIFTGADGSASKNGALIQAFVDGTPGLNDMPSRLVFSTTADGASSPTERMRVDSSGNVGIGTTSFDSNWTPRLQVSGTASDGTQGILIENYKPAITFKDISGGSPERKHIWADGNALYLGSGDTSQNSQLAIDSSGRLLVGTSSSRDKFFNSQTLHPGIQLEGTSFQGRVLSIVSNNNAENGAGSGLILGRQRSGANGGYTLVSNNDVFGGVYFQGADGGQLVEGAKIEAEVDGTPGANDMPGRLVFSTTADGASSPTQRMRINSGGTLTAFAGTIHQFKTARTSGSDEFMRFMNGATTMDNGTTRCRIRADGDLENTNNSYTGISDQKLKENIVEANSQWSDIKALQVRNYNFKQETNYGTHTQIGLIAQEVEIVSPGLVKEINDVDAEGNDLGTTTKSVNYSVLYMKAVKALQEAMDRIETLEAKVAALEAA